MQNGVLISLYKKGQAGKLLTAEQVAKCVKFVLLEYREVEDEDGEMDGEMISTPYQGDIRGLKVNAIGGATGAGKTSLINIMAGGSETEPKATSDTKCPTVYLFNFAGKMHALLDTAGLCDTAVTAEKDGALKEGMQELLINAVAATVKMYDMQIVSFLVCVEVSGRVPGNFFLVWPEMVAALGGDELEKICRFVVTKVNVIKGDTVGKKNFRHLPETQFYKDLQDSKWPVCSAGRGNLERITEMMFPMSTVIVGVGGDSVDADTMSLSHKEKVVQDLKSRLQKSKADEGLATASAKERYEHTGKLIRERQQAIDDAYVELASMGNCQDEEKTRLKGLIDSHRAKLEALQRQHAHGVDSTESIRAQLDVIQSDIEKEMAGLEKMHSVGAFFKGLGTAVANKVTNLTSGVAK